MINQVGGQRPTYVCTYVRTYVAAHVRVVRAGLVLRMEIDTCVRENVRTYVSSSPFAAGFTCVCTYVRILPEAPGGAEWYVRAYYRARAAKHNGKYVRTYRFTYVRTYVLT